MFLLFRNPPFRQPLFSHFVAVSVVFRWVAGGWVGGGGLSSVHGSYYVGSYAQLSSHSSYHTTHLVS